MCQPEEHSRSKAVLSVAGEAPRKHTFSTKNPVPTSTITRSGCDSLPLTYSEFVRGTSMSFLSGCGVSMIKPGNELN